MSELTFSRLSSLASYQAIQTTFLWLVSWCVLLSGCTSPTLPTREASQLATDPSASAARSAEELFVCDCLLPGQLRKLGRLIYLTPRRPIKTSVRDCEIRGGEYVAYDRSNYATALKVWLEQAQQGDKMAQTYVGEIYEKGLGIPPDYRQAAAWYQKAAEQGYAPAQINLGHLYEKGLGVEQDPVRALHWYRKASGLSEAMVLDPGSLNIARGEELSEAERLTAQQVPLAGPTIEIIDPLLATRGGPPRVTTRPGTERLIVGRVTAAAGLRTLTVNERDEQLNPHGLFSVLIAVQHANVPVQIVAIDQQGKRTTTEFLLVPAEAGQPPPPPPPPSAGIDFGRYYALVIGNRDYAHWKDLKTPENDATQVATVLREKYGFTTQMLLNGTRRTMLQALHELRQKLTEKDNLLIYYAGHGQLDEKIARGYWVPVDGELDSPVDWIPTVAITDFLSAMSAKHVLVVADSCYAGALTRSALARLEAGMSEEARQHWLKIMSQKRARLVLSSGDVQPVLDIGGGKHSVFAKAFLDVLYENHEIFVGQQLYSQVSARVAHAAESFRFEQIPQYAPIRFTGHEAGDFIFVPVAKQRAVRR